MALFSGTDVLGVTPEQIGTPTRVCWGFQSLEQISYGMVDEKPLRQPLRFLQLSRLSHGTDVWLGNAHRI